MVFRRAFHEWVGAFSGIAFVGIFLGSMILSGDDAVLANAPSAAIAQALVERRSAVWLSTYLSILSIFPFLWFLTYLRQHLQEAEGAKGWVTSLAHSGGLVAGSALLFLLAIRLAGAVLSDYGGDTQVAKTLFVLTQEWDTVLGPPLAALVGGTAAVSLRFAALPRWLGILGLPLAVLLLAPAPWGILAFFPWLVAVSIGVLIRRGAKPVTDVR